jgi:uncharacterized protein YgfB (UPF0149 family)
VLCAPRPSAEALGKTVLADMNPGADTREVERLLGALRATTQMRLTERDSEFTPLLPGEDAGLAERVAALADFCRGYVMGLLAGGVSDLAALPGDAREVVEDMIKIAQAEAGETAEAEERALAELTEYVRVGVQVVYEALHADD